MLLNSHGAFNRKLSFAVRCFCTVIISFSTGCGSNLFETFATQDDGPSLLRAAKDSLAGQDYASAVASCELMDADDASGEEALYICASAYAGVCGYSLFTVINQITTYNGTSPLLFEYFMTKSHGATLATVASCNTALTKVRAIGAAATRTGDQNYLALFSGFTNMGAVLNLLADTDDDDDPDAGFNACQAGSMSNAQATQFGKALWELYRSAEVITSSISEIGALKDALDDVSDAIDLLDPTLNFLKSTANPDAFTANQLRGIRTLIKEGQVLGLDYCANFVACLCP